jgi:hypothetical protein
VFQLPQLAHLPKNWRAWAPQLVQTKKVLGLATN